MKLFVSYRSLDSAKVDHIIAQIRAMTHDDGTPRFQIWQDKWDIPPGQDWWKAIIDAIKACDIFIYMISQESVKNPHCRAELDYAYRRNRPIIPLVLPKEYELNTGTGKLNIAFWESMPDELKDSRIQMLFYKEDAFASQFETAVAQQIKLNLRDIPASEPHDPRQQGDEARDAVSLYDSACDAAWRMDFDTAERLFQRLIRWNDATFGEEAYQWVGLLREYRELLTTYNRPHLGHRFRLLWGEYLQRFPVMFMDGVFDPADIATAAAQSLSGTGPLNAQRVQVAQSTMQAAGTAPRRPVDEDHRERRRRSDDVPMSGVLQAMINMVVVFMLSVLCIVLVLTTITVYVLPQPDDAAVGSVTGDGNNDDINNDDSPMLQLYYAGDTLVIHNVMDTVAELDNLRMVTASGAMFTPGTIDGILLSMEPNQCIVIGPAQDDVTAPCGSIAQEMDAAPSMPVWSMSGNDAGTFSIMAANDDVVLATCNIAEGHCTIPQQAQ